MDQQQSVATGRLTLDEAAVQDFTASLRGEVLRPTDEGYDEARTIHNGMIDRRPTLIARCAGVADVMASVQFARDQQLLVSVRCGGHGIAGFSVCDGGLMIDLSHMRGVRVDAARQTARAEGGATWGDFDHETQAFGLATTGGVARPTGIAGLTLGGGIGWLMRKHGLTCDNLLSADVVTADGRFLRASKREHADLFWGLRGGGGNFGIVTAFEYRLHPVGPQVPAGVILHPAERAPEVLRFYRDWIATAPDELTTIVIFRKAPPALYLPEHVHGRAVVIVAVCYAGPVEEGERVLAPLRRFGEPLVDLIRPTAYTLHQGIFDPSVPHGLHYYWKSHYLGPLGDAAIDTLAAQAWRVPSPTSFTVMFHMGGAVRRVGGAETAFEDRSAEHALNINGAWSDPQATDQHIAWVRGFWEVMRPYSTGGVYVNFLADEGEEQVRAAYGSAEKYGRLAALKKAYDPTNLFRINQNIRPAA